MKKIYKISLFLALILMAAGMAVSLVGRSMGGREKMDELVSGLIQMQLRFHGDAPGSVEFDGRYPVLGGDLTKELEEAPIHGLNASLSGVSFRVIASDEERARLESRNIRRAQCYMEDDCLHIRASAETDRDGENGEITLYLPRETLLSDFSAEMGAGSFEAQGLKTRSFSFSLGAGEIRAAGLEAEEAEWNLDMGEIEITDSGVKDMYFHVGTGSLSYGGRISGNLTGDCDVGNISLELEENRKAYDYSIHTDLGTVRLDGEDRSLGMLELSRDNGAGREISLDCAVGNVEISFTNQD